MAMRLLLSLKIASLLPQTWSPLRPTSVQDKGKILSVQVSVPPPSVELLPTVMVVFSRARPLVGGEGVQKTGEATVRVDAVPDVGGVRRLVCGVLCGVPLAGSRGAVEPLAQVRVDVAVVAVVAAVAVAVTRFCRVEAQHLDDLVGHERDAVGGVACVVLIGHDPDDRAAVQAAELDLRLVCEVAQFLGHELCLLSVMV